jgi:hypothetical protein
MRTNRRVQMAARDRVRIYPVADYYMPGVRAVERLVPAEVADVLLASPHPAFTRQRPETQEAPATDVPEDIDDILLAMPELTPRDSASVPESPPSVMATTPGGSILEPVRTEGSDNA